MMKIKNMLIGSLLSVAVITSVPTQVDASGEQPILSSDQEGRVNKTLNQELSNTLVEAACEGNVEKAREALDNGANINATTDTGSTALMKAVNKNHIGVVTLLLEAGVDINFRTRSGNTALVAAIENRSRVIVDLLLQANADVNFQDSSGQTPLTRACNKSDLGIAIRLIRAGARAGAKSIPSSVLISLAEKGHVDIVEKLLDHGADIRGVDQHGRSVLMLASRNGHINLVEKLLNHGVNVNLKDNYGCTALMWAAHNGYTNITQALLLAGANKDLLSDGKVIPNYEARKPSIPGVYHFMNSIESSADIGIGGKSAFQYAKRNGHHETAEVILHFKGRFSKTKSARCGKVTAAS